MVKRFVIPPQQNAEFVCQMEEVLTVYASPYDPLEPVVCLDEQPQVLRGHARDPLPMEPGVPARVDDEYRRQGTANVFCLFEPLRGWREMRVTERRTLQDFAQTLKHLSDIVYPQARVIHLVLDNLNTHKKAALYATFCPEEAARLGARFHFHHTPKHGSWLNAAEIELSVFSRQCTDRRLEGVPRLIEESAAWTAERNLAKAQLCWHFTTGDARVKLCRLYPSLTP